MLRSIGADETVDYEQTNFVDQGVQYDLIFDIPSNLSFEQSTQNEIPAQDLESERRDHSNP